MKKVLFIYNPVSGNHTIKENLDYIIQEFFKKNIIVIPYRLGDFKVRNLVKAFKEFNLDFVVISGGDGTLNHIINLMMKNNIQVPVGILPTGTCNDFASSLDIPSNIKKCVKIILDGNIKEVDVGCVNEETFFLSTCAGGIFADISFTTNNELKKNLGPFAYYFKALSEVKKMKSFKVKIQTDREYLEEKVLLFLILNGKQGGGFSNIIDDVDISDGLMDLVLFKNCSPIELASLFFTAISHEPLNNKNVKVIKTKTCTIKGLEEVGTSIDGEKGTNLPLEVKFKKKALKVFVK